MRRKTLFISHELLETFPWNIPVNINISTVSQETSNFLMSLVAERAEWVSNTGDRVIITEGVPHDAKITAMARDFSRAGWLFLVDAESFPDVPEGQLAPEINPICNITRKVIP